MLSNIQNPQTICVLRLSAIGDVCHAVATVQAIQKRWPQAKLTWVIGKIEYQLVRGLAGVEFVVFDKRAGLQAYKDLKANLKHQQFDILLHMQVALRASLATLCINAREKWGFDKKRAREGQWMFTNRRINPQNSVHVADTFLEFGKAIGVEQDYQLSWQMPIGEAAEQWQKEQLGGVEKYVVIAAAASKAERNWLPQRYAEFASYVHAKGYTVVLCGGPGDLDQRLSQQIRANCNFKVIDLVAKTSLKQLLAVIKHANLVLAPDTGPTHMAVTVNTPVIGLYAHSNPKRTGPYHFQQYIVSYYEKLLASQTGQSSEQSRWGKRVKGDDLMHNIQLEDVTQKFDQILCDASQN